ncbi:LysR family transcriptional regulator [Thaumasiovibrio subtropicus]|uniref:LysR family transcriptional regulator n=1 Tax=Thaumasiovibrio subtropicus TaxID=1891207 RepID=UPI000B35317D|nr:LysR family transcriptional regulator [Thaumasiovibrio subtropicus]
MAKDLYQNLDLNLLRTLLVIYQERNLRKAAERLFVTQPAVSQALQKLRHHFDDELFVKVRSGLAPTPYTDELCLNLIPVLEHLSATLNQQQQLDLSHLERTVRIAVSPQFLCRLGSHAYHFFKQAAPHVRIELHEWHRTTLSLIEEGFIDLGINRQLAVSSAIYTHPILESLRGCIYVRQEHPFKGDVIRAEDTAQFQWVNLILPGFTDIQTEVEKILNARDIPCRIAHRTTSTYNLIETLKSTDLLFPSGANFFPHTETAFRTIPIHEEDEFALYDVVAFMHKKHTKDPLHTWLLDNMSKLL